MTSIDRPGSEGVVRVEELLALYDQHRYLDAFRASEPLWQPSTDVERLSTDELLLAGRLAARLGGLRLSRALLRKALERDSLHPGVRYHCRHLLPSRRRLFDDLRAFEEQPDVGGDDPRLRAWWFASYAGTWASFHDVRRASECLNRAHSLSPDDGWVLACESMVQGMADRREEALDAAERACHLEPGAPYAFISLGTCLLSLGRVEDAAARLYAAAEQNQSYDLTLDACWRQCALAETQDGADRRSTLDRAAVLADRLSSLAPLADREAQVVFARARLDIAALSDDYDAIERWSGRARSPFHHKVLANLRRNTEGRRLRLRYRRVVQKRDACLPASLSAALSANGIRVSADDMASEITFGGTAPWAAADWLRTRGCHVRFLAVTPGLARRLIGAGIAFVLAWDGEESAHAVAVVGVDERAETLIVHDPNSFRETECLQDIVDRDQSPLGIRGMAVVAQDRASVLDGLLTSDCDLAEAAQAHMRAMTTEGPSAAQAIVVDVNERFPAHPGTRYLRAVQWLEEGHVGRALGELTALLAQFPNSPVVRLGTIAACRAVGNTALVRTVLSDIVERGVLPGLVAQRGWDRPPERYVQEYADILRLSLDSRDRAERLLHSSLRRQPASAGAWHTLGDLLSDRFHPEEALLCHRLAACLAVSDEHFARAYADALVAGKRDQEAFEWLESRVRTTGSSSNSAAWLTWISALEDHGRPAEALAACREALGRHANDGQLLAFSVSFFARMGSWDVALGRLHALECLGHPAFHEAAANFWRMRGGLARALDHGEAWIRETPRSMTARAALLDLVATHGGVDAAVERAARWTKENGEHEGFEGAYCGQVDRAGGPWRKKYGVLLRRLRRNREDAWAWRELTFDCLRDHRQASGKRRRRLARRIEACLAECDRTSAGSAPTIRAHALWCEERGDLSGAIARHLESIEREPAHFFSYQHVWQCSARFPDEERRRVWGMIRTCLLGAPGRIATSRHMLALVAERFGAAEAEREADEWRAARPDDPDVLEAAADLLIDQGHGQSDGRKALDMLRPAVKRFPYHAGLQMSLAGAYRAAGEDAEAEKVLHEIVKGRPGATGAAIQLAWLKQSFGNAHQAYQLLDDALESAPLEPFLLEARARILLANGAVDEACQHVHLTLSRMPRNVDWRCRAVGLLTDARAFDDAIATARHGVDILPRNATLWLLLGTTLIEMKRYAAPGEIENCLRRSLALDASSFPSAEALATWLLDRERYGEAAQTIRDIEPRLADPSPAWGWQAWIRRRQGEKAEALKDIIAVVEAAPWYRTGWGVLCDWLEEDEAWEEARRLLRQIPGPVANVTALSKRRLQLLERAGVDRVELDGEWERVLRDHPLDASLQAGRTQVLDRRAEADNPASQFSVPEVSPWIWWGALMLAMQALRNCQ